MTTVRRNLLTIASAGLSVLLLVGSASADPITGQISAFGNVPGIANTDTTGSATAAKFDAVATNAAIQAACPAGYTCSALTITDINFAITANVTGSILVTNAAVSYIGPITGALGTFNNATSGQSLRGNTIVSLNDPLSGTLGSIATALPTFSVATTNEYKGTSAGGGTCGTAGAATSTKYVNCLTLAAGSRTFNGTPTDTGTGAYSTSDSSLTQDVLNQYVKGILGGDTVSFGLVKMQTSEQGTTFGSISAANSSTLDALADGLEVDYLYTYDQTMNPPPPSGTPEPATMALMGGALLGLGFLGKKRRQS